MNQLSLAPAGAGYTNSQSWFNSLEEILGDIYIKRSTQHDPVACRTGRNWSGHYTTDLRQILYDDFQILLPHDYLTKVDVASMATSLEVRPPFLDHHLIEAAWSLPDSMKLKFGQPKFLLKRIAAKHIPPELIYRPKMGFAMPLKHWWRGRLAHVLRELMTDSSAVKLGLIKPEPVITALDQHVAGKANNDTRLWIVLCLELWVRVVLDKTIPRTSSLSNVSL
jgi:asparagine synthase (glutamine-hydrolysing)